MATARPMYTMKAHYSFGENVQLPDVMYKLPNVLGNKEASETKASPEMILLKDRQDRLLQRLDDLIGEVKSIETSIAAEEQVSSENKNFQGDAVTDVVIHASPNNPPLCLKYIQSMLKKKHKVLLKVHYHSSLRKQPNLEKRLCNEECTDRSLNQIIITVIFKQVDGGGPLAFLSPSMQTPICGESNIARLFGRILGIYDCGPDTDAFTTKSDVLLDACDAIASPCTSAADKSSALEILARGLEKQSYLSGSEPSIADAVALSTLLKSGLEVQSPALRKWFQHGNKLLY